MNMIAVGSPFCHQPLQEFSALIPLRVYTEIYAVRKTLVGTRSPCGGQLGQFLKTGKYK